MYNDAVKDLPKKLEQYRQEKGLTKTEMAHLLGASSYQVYYSWITRNSIPKQYLDRARALLAAQGTDVELEAEILEKVARLPNYKAKLVLQMIDGLLDSQES